MFFKFGKAYTLVTNNLSHVTYNNRKDQTNQTINVATKRQEILACSRYC